MTRTTPTFLCVLTLAALGCDPTLPRTAETNVDCTVADGYEFGSEVGQTINLFNGTGDPGWYGYCDTTKPPFTDILYDLELEDTQQLAIAKEYGLSYVEFGTLEQPLCGIDMEDLKALHLEAHGYNFWGAGFADWQHEPNPADGTGFEGISFWARSEPGTDKTFTFYVDDGRTVVTKESKEIKGIVVNGVCETACNRKVLEKNVRPDGYFDDPNLGPCIPENGVLDSGIPCIKYNAIRPTDQDLNQNGFLDPGDIAAGTTCRVPPMQTVCDPACYAGGVQPPTAAACVPEPDQCGNSFRTYVTTTDNWQLFLIPWSDLTQSPCPNRVEGGLVDFADIRKFEIKVKQGTSNNIWIDRLEFYRRRTSASQ